MLSARPYAGCLNAPFGARCFLTTKNEHRIIDLIDCLNAPFGARCFLTIPPRHHPTDRLPS